MAQTSPRRPGSSCKRIGILTGGGDVPGLNSVVKSVVYRSTEYEGDKYHFCSDGCKDIFENEPEKFSQSWLPVQQIFQGNCGGAGLEDVLQWYGLDLGVDDMDYVGSPEEKRWKEWKGLDDEQQKKAS